MRESESARLFAKGLYFFEKGEFSAALIHFEKAHQLDPTPDCCSHLAYCLARERGQFKMALALCTEALEKEPDKPLHYLHLGRVHILRGQKVEAIQTFRQGLGHGDEPLLRAELDNLGTRKPPVISFLTRDNPVNKYLGMILAKLGLR